MPLTRQVLQLISAAKEAISDLEDALETVSDERDDVQRQLEKMTAERDRLWDKINEGQE